MVIVNIQNNHNSNYQIIQYASLGNAVDFGDPFLCGSSAACSNSTRAVICRWIFTNL